MFQVSNILHNAIRCIVFSMYLISLVFGSGLHLHEDDGSVHEDELVLHAHDSIETFQTHVNDATLTQNEQTHNHSVATVHLLASLTRTQHSIVSYSKQIEMESCSDISISSSMETCKQLYLHDSDPPILQGITPDRAGRAPPTV
ncbi:MAG: hypothetical protein HY960_07005 [Ignavibacteriae bacterium]|nr:hypothetical protein [Ignavibacteriota bacterium]